MRMVQASFKFNTYDTFPTLEKVHFKNVQVYIVLKTKAYTHKKAFLVNHLKYKTTPSCMPYEINSQSTFLLYKMTAAYAYDKLHY